MADNPTERKAQLRSLAVLVRAYAPGKGVDELLRTAESGEAADLEAARAAFDQLPSLDQRRIISTFGAVMWTPSAARKALRQRGVR